MNYQSIVIYESFPSLTRTGRTKVIKQLIHNPTANERWFYFVKTKNIHGLQAMIKDGFKIDTIDTNGASIVHLCLHYKSRQLLNFAIENKANFNQKDIFENHPINMIFQKNYTYYFFKKIISLFELSKIIPEHENSLIFASYYDNNLSKIKFFIKRNPFLSRQIIEKMSQASNLKDAQKNWLYLSGKEQLLKKLKRLPIKQNLPAVKI